MNPMNPMNTFDMTCTKLTKSPLQLRNDTSTCSLYACFAFNQKRRWPYVIRSLSQNTEPTNWSELVSFCWQWKLFLLSIHFTLFVLRIKSFLVIFYTWRNFLRLICMKCISSLDTTHALMNVIHLRSFQLNSLNMTHFPSLRNRPFCLNHISVSLNYIIRFPLYVRMSLTLYTVKFIWITAIFIDFKCGRMRTHIFNNVTYLTCYNETMTN